MIERKLENDSTRSMEDNTGKRNILLINILVVDNF